jgi:Uma2 family endonuclease
MNLMLTQPNPTWTIQQLRKHFGMIPADRILLDPAPGTATEKDVTFMDDHRNRLCELVDGVLVEKAMGYKESLLAAELIFAIKLYLRKQDLGIVLGADGFLRLVIGLVRAPDVSFISWDRLPGGELPDQPIPSLVPDLAVEVLSKGNTKREIDRKLREYFETGVRLVWVCIPKTRTVEVYTSLTERHELSVGQTLNGGKVLPGFKLALAKLFAPIRRRKGR